MSDTELACALDLEHRAVSSGLHGWNLLEAELSAADPESVTVTAGATPPTAKFRALWAR